MVTKGLNTLFTNSLFVLWLSPFDYYTNIGTFHGHGQYIVLPSLLRANYNNKAFCSESPEGKPV